MQKNRNEKWVSAQDDVSPPKKHSQRTLLKITLLLVVCLFSVQTMAQQSSVCYSDHGITTASNGLVTPMFTGTLPFPTSNKSCDADRNVTTANIFNSFFRKQQSFSPANPNIYPYSVPKKIKIRFIVLESDPSGPKKNYRYSDAAALRQFVVRTNELLGQMLPPSSPQCSTCYQPDSRLRLELTGIDFLWDPKLTYDPDSASGFINSGRGKDSILNIYFVYNPSVNVGGGWASFPAAFGYLNAPFSFIALRNYYSTGADLVNSEPRRLIHELGHVLGLAHVYPNRNAQGVYTGTDEREPGTPDYLSDIFGASGQHYPLTTVTNNYMDAAGTTANYMSPLQLGREHRNAFLSSARSYVYPVEQPGEHPWVISQDQTWNFPIRLFQNLRINAGATLTIRCQVEMPDKGNIIIEPGGKLIVDGGILTSYHSKIGWEGIQVKGNGSRPSKPEYQGTLEMKNGAVIQNAWEGIWNYSTENYAADGAGGIVRVTDSRFYNCRKAVDMADYENYSYTYSGVCNGLFSNVDFLIDDQSPFVFQYGEAGYEYFTTDRIKTGIQVVNCRFKNSIPYSLQAQYDRGTAMRLFETGMIVSGCSFDGFMDGIKLHGYTGSPRTLTVLNNRFNHITRNITVASSGFSSIRGNTVTNIINPDISIVDQPGWGIFLDNAKGVYVGCGNVISGTTDHIDDPAFELPDRRGLIVQDSRTFGGTLTDNTFNDIAVGSQTQRNNRQFNMFCNTYYKNKAAWKINPQSPGFSFHDQGTGCASGLTRAGNVFRSNTRDIVNYTSTWRYYAFGGNPPEVPAQNVNFSGLNICTPGGTQDPNSLCQSAAPGPRPNISVCNQVPMHPTLLNSIIKNYNIFAGQGLKQEADPIMLFQQIVSGFYELDDEPGLVTFLEGQNDDNARRLLIPLYVDQFRFSDARAAISVLQIDPAEKSGYLNYYNILIDLKVSKRGIENLDEDEWTIIMGLAHADLEVSAFAKALLARAGRESWVHIVEEASDMNAPEARNKRIAVTEGSHLGAASPNPAGTRTVINVYIAADDAGRKPVLLLRDAMGALLVQKELNEGDNYAALSTENYPAGYYFYTLQLGGHNFDTKKLILIK